jgi:hypothetical protein
MLVLTIAVAAIAGFAVLLALLSFARFAERRQILAERVAPEPLFAGLSYSQAFDDDYGLIWQTQVPALELVRNAGGQGLPVQSLKPWFSRAMHCYPDLFEGHTFQEWLDFLHRSRVAQCGNDRVVLTALGYELLDHCRMAG